jgi:small-conductance mechanosensitive channel
MNTRIHKKASAFCLLCIFAVSVSLLVVFTRALAAQGGNQLSGDDIITHLSMIIAWYEDVTTKVQPTGYPTDAIYQENAQGVAADAVRLAFQSARAEAPLATAVEKNANRQANQVGSGSGVSQAVSRAQAQISVLQTQIAALNKQIASAPAKKRQALTSQRDNLQGQLELNEAVLDAAQKVADFMETSGGGVGGGLSGSVNRLAQSIPEVMGKTTTNTLAKPANSAAVAPSNSGGLAAQAFALWGVVRTLREIDALISETGRVEDAAARVRKPLRDGLRAIAQQGDAGLGQPPPASGSTTAPGQASAQAATRVDYGAMTQQFKQLASATIPLSQEILLLEQSKTNLLEWRRAIVRESGVSFRRLMFHLVLIATALALVLIFSEVWRRFTFRYIKDARRRRQFLVLRRFVIGFLMGIILILGLVSQFSSLATFAGFVTAGVAVGLQAVLLSVAAYFFLIGRWGIRVGDRVSISGVTGDVIDVGLVRFYMMELAGTGIDFYQTGRIVVFANSVLFQSNTPLFKQIPGTEYAWHEVVVSLAAGANYKAVQEWLTSTVNSVYVRYRGEIERQLDSIEERIDMRLTIPETEGRLQFADLGLEYLVRYPVEIRRSAEIDEEITRTVMETLGKDANLKAAVQGVPRIRTAVRG